MAKKPIDLVADHFQIPAFEAREILNDIQNRLIPPPTYKLLAEVLLNNADISDADELASIIIGIDPVYRYKYQQVTPAELRKEKDILFKMVAQYLYPEISPGTFRKIGKSEIQDKSPSGMAAYITENVLGFVLKENISLYKGVQSKTYPQTRTTDFSRIRNKYPLAVSIDSIVNLLISNFDYIRVEDKDLYLKVKTRLFPELPLQIFQSVHKSLSKKNAQTIIDSIVRQYDEFMLDQDYQKIKNLIYPEPEPKFLKQFLKEHPEINDPGQIVRKITSDVAEYIPVYETPLYNRVNDSFYEHVPIHIFSTSRKEHPGQISFEVIVHDIDVNCPHLRLKLYQEAQQMILPEPSIEQLRKVRLSSELNLSKTKLVNQFLNNSLNYIQDKDLDLYQKVKREIYPPLQIRVFNQSRNVLSGSSVAKEIVDDISNNTLAYMSITSFERLNQLLFPAISKSEALEFKKAAWVGISPQELAGLIAEKSSLHISGNRLALFRKTDHLLYPDLTLADFLAGLNKVGEEACAEELSVSLQEMDNKYILLSKCDQIRKLIYPKITDREILNYCQTKKTIRSAERIASSIISRSGKYTSINRGEKKKGIKISKKWDWDY